MPEVLLCQNVPASPVSTIPTTDGVLTSNNIKSSEFNHIKVENTLTIATTGTSLLAPMNVKLKLNGTTLFTWVFQTQSALVGQETVNLSYISDARQAGGLSAGGVLTLTASTAVADTHTTMTVLSTYVYSLDD
jgi:hypothetical protein